MNYLVAVDNCFADTPSGSARVAWDIAKMARDRGWSVSMLCLNPKPEELPDGPSENEGITVVRYSKPRVSGWHPMRTSKLIDAAAYAFDKWLGKVRWDTIHIHTPITGAGVMKAAGDTSRFVYTVHSPVVSEQEINWANQGCLGRAKLVFGLPILKSLEKRLLTRSSEIHALSEFTRSEIQRFHGIGNRVTVIPHWCRDGFGRSFTKPEARKILGLPNDSTIFFTVRQHKERYGIDVAIRALAALAAKHRWTFYIGGDGPLRPKFESLASQLGVDDHITFMGHLTDEVLALAYQAADAFLLPTIALECFGLIILEALACECPIIATDAGAIPEIMRPILSDFIVPAGDPDALKEKIQAVLEKRLKFPPSSSLAAFADSKYGKSVIVPKLLGLLQPSGKCGKQQGKNSGQIPGEMHE